MSEYRLREGVDQNAGGSHQPGHGKGQIEPVYQQGKEWSEEAAVSIVDKMPKEKEACSPPGSVPYFSTHKGGMIALST